MKSAGELPRSVRTRTRTQQSGTRTRSLVIEYEYEYHRKRLSTSTNARQIELTISGSLQAAARLSGKRLGMHHFFLTTFRVCEFELVT